MFASDEDIVRVARSLTNYAGPYTLVEKEGEIWSECEVDIALDPSWIGSLQVRKVELGEREGKKVLVLRPVQVLVMLVGF
jgi:hypothetical protein